MTRIEATYRYGEAVDVYGNRSSARWSPRYCNKGQALVRKVYGDRRVKTVDFATFLPPWLYVVGLAGFI